MFEISWSELLILAVVTLICVGPKELPALFNTLGRYMGQIRRHAAEFRRQFEEAMQTAEFDRINKEVMQLRDEVKNTVTEAGSLADKKVAEVKSSAEDALPREGAGTDTAGASAPVPPASKG